MPRPTDSAGTNRGGTPTPGPVGPAPSAGTNRGPVSCESESKLAQAKYQEFKNAEAALNKANAKWIVPLQKEINGINMEIRDLKKVNPNDPRIPDLEATVVALEKERDKNMKNYEVSTAVDWWNRVKEERKSADSKLKECEEKNGPSTPNE